MDNQLEKSETLIQSIAVIALAALFVILLVVLSGYQSQVSDPYKRSVLSLKGDPVQGQAIFQMNCAGCHGLEADGQVGPSLRHISDRKSKPRLIHQVISGETPPMPQFQPNPKEMADLLSYLEQL